MLAEEAAVVVRSLPCCFSRMNSKVQRIFRQPWDIRSPGDLPRYFPLRRKKRPITVGAGESQADGGRLFRRRSQPGR